MQSLGLEVRSLAFIVCVTPSTVLSLSKLLLSPLLSEHHNGPNLGALNIKHPAPAWHTGGMQ